MPSTPHDATRPAPTHAAEDAESGSQVRRRAHSEAMNAIGARLRVRRTDRGLSLRQLAQDLDISASFLSQVENGKALPSVATLYLICSALELSIDELFAGAGWRLDDAGIAAGPTSSAPPRTAPSPLLDGRAVSPVVRPAERRRLVLDSGVIWEQLSTLPDGAIDFMFVRYDVGGSSTLDERLTRHSGVEYGFVMRGILEVMLGFETYRVGPGDAISFDSSTPHRLSNVGEEPVEAVWFVRGRDARHPH